MLDVTRMGSDYKMGYCDDLGFLEPWSDKPYLITHVRYINTNKGPAWICQDCLEQWSDELESYCDNKLDLNLGDGYPFIP